MNERIHDGGGAGSDLGGTGGSAMSEPSAPVGWTQAAIKNIAGSDGLFVDGDWVESKDQDPNGDIRLLQLADIGDGVFLNKSDRWINEDAFTRLRCTQLQPGDVLVARMPDPLGRACLMPQLQEKCVTVVDVAALRVAAGNVDNRWVMHTVNAPQVRAQIEAHSSGTTRKRIARGKLGEMEIPLPPAAEQKRIADKLDTVLTRVDAVNTRLARVAPLLKRFRQSVLAAATSGRLTENWRETEDLPPVTEPVLRAKRLQHATSSKDARITSDLIERGCHLSTNDLLPETWVCTCIGMTGIVSNGSTPSRAELNYWGGNIPWVSSGEVRNNRICTTKERISQQGFDSSSVKLLPAGAVLIAMIGEGKTRGQSALLDIEATINQNIAAVAPCSELIEPEYLWFWFQSQYEANRLAGNGTGPQALNCQKVRELPLNLPPKQEQTEIVRRVETLFAFADRLEARLAQAQTAATRLTPALLSKAFRGELVAQDPNDEPAAELLRRLAQAPAAASPRRGRKAAGAAV